MTTKERLIEFLKLQNTYAFTTRTLVTPDRYKRIALSGFVDKKDYTNDVLREPLIEHIGHLPILASYWHPYIEHTDKVDLGKVLTMLSIHDIGETVTGEICAYHKTEEDGDDEYKAALEVMHPNYHAYMDEFEALETYDAKFAKAIDAIAPNIRAVDMPKVTIARAK